MTREQAYDAHIKPLLEQIDNLCHVHRIPMVAAFQLEDDVGDKTLFAVAVNVDGCANVSGRLNAARKVLELDCADLAERLKR